MTDKLDLDAIEARCNAATEGPWDASYLPSGYGYDGALFDRRFIAHARQDIPALIAEVRELQKRLKRWEPRMPDFDEATHAAQRQLRS